MDFHLHSGNWVYMQCNMYVGESKCYKAIYFISGKLGVCSKIYFLHSMQEMVTQLKPTQHTRRRSFTKKATEIIGS